MRHDRAAWSNLEIKNIAPHPFLRVRSRREVAPTGKGHPSDSVNRVTERSGRPGGVKQLAGQTIPVTAGSCRFGIWATLVAWLSPVESPPYLRRPRHGAEVA